MPTVHCGDNAHLLVSGVQDLPVEPGPTTNYQCCWDAPPSECGPVATFTMVPIVIPEPAIFYLLMAGVLLLWVLRRLR